MRRVVALNDEFEDVKRKLKDAKRKRVAQEWLKP
jgi:hypothetical protein